MILENKDIFCAKNATRRLEKFSFFELLLASNLLTNLEFLAAGSQTRLLMIAIKSL